MRAVVTRVKEASVHIEGKIQGQIGLGYLVLLGIGPGDTRQEAQHLAEKICNLRVFEDEAGKMNLNLATVGGSLLVVSQFTLHASTKKGNRPSYIKAAKPEVSIPLYEQFCQALSEMLGKPIQTGEFGADMQVELINDGPVTIWIDSKVKE